MSEDKKVLCYFITAVKHGVARAKGVGDQVNPFGDFGVSLVTLVSHPDFGDFGVSFIATDFTRGGVAPVFLFGKTRSRMSNYTPYGTYANLSSIACSYPGKITLQEFARAFYLIESCKTIAVALTLDVP